MRVVDGAGEGNGGRRLRMSSTLFAVAVDFVFCLDCLA